VATLVYRFGETGLKDAEREIARLLEHGDTFERRAAVWVLSRHWGMVTYREQLSRIALQDRDALVRKMAVIGLGILLRGTRDQGATQLLVSLLRDANTHWIVRGGAYLALLGVWLPQTADIRESWQGWRPWRTPDEKAGRDWDAEWLATLATRVDWSLVSSLERGAS
jgi:hypothetical protein